MSIELMLFIAVALVIVVIILWPLLKNQPPAKRYPQRQARGGLTPYPTPGPRFGYRSPSPPSVADDRIVDAGDTVPAVVDVVVLALRAGHELVEGTHPDPEAVQPGCADPERVDETGEPLRATTGTSVCRVDLDEARTVEPASVAVTSVEEEQPET